MDTLTTSAFQWCELRGYDPADTIEEKGGSAGRAGEWINKKAGTGSGTGSGGGSGAAAASGAGFATTRGGAAAAQPEVRWHERPEHCGWLTKKGEHLSTWRKRWFVLKDQKLAGVLVHVHTHFWSYVPFSRTHLWSCIPFTHTHTHTHMHARTHTHTHTPRSRPPPQLVCFIS